MPQGTLVGHLTPGEAARTLALTSEVEGLHPVARKSATVRELEARWVLPLDLMGGTITMRARGETWLPKEEKEGLEAYRSRLLRSFLYPAYESAWDHVCSQPFERPVNLVGEPPVGLELLERNADKQGNTLTEFAKQIQAAAHLGMALIIVDFAADGRGMTLAQQRARKAYPYLVLVRPEQVLGWRARTNSNGEQELEMLRYREHITEPDGEFGEQEVMQVRVWYAPEAPEGEQGKAIFERFRLGEVDRDAFIGAGGVLGRWEVWRQDSETSASEWTVAMQGEHDYPGIPLVDHYTQREGFLEASPPMEQLAWKNLEHWQSASDQRHILRYSRFAVLFQCGVSEDEMDNPVQVGPVAIIRTTSTAQEASLEYVEIAGAGIQAGDRDLERLRSEMDELRHRTMSRRTGTSTATGEALDEGRQVSQVKAWVRGLEKTLRRCYEVAAVWLRETVDDDFKVDVHDNFTLSLRGEKDSEFLLKLWQADGIDHLTFLEELRLRGLIDENRDLDAVIALSDEESKSKGRGMVGLGFGDDGDTGDDEVPEDPEGDDARDPQATPNPAAAG